MNIPKGDLSLVNPVLNMSFTPDRGTAWFNAKYRDGYNPGYKNPGDPEGHAGIDLHAPAGSPAVAPFDGTIRHAGWGNSGSGNVVCVVRPAEPSGWWLARLLHLKPDSFTVTVGDEVSQGDKVAEVGCTGQCTYPHIHFEIRYLTVPYNPKVDSVKQGIKLDPLAFGLLPGLESPYYDFTAPPGPAPVRLRPLALGDKDDAVIVWRSLLYALGYGGRSTLRFRGFGPTVERKTRRFQKDRDLLPADGMVTGAEWVQALNAMIGQVP